MRAFSAWASAMSPRCTASKSATCKPAMTLPEPESSPWHPVTREGKSQALWVLNTLTGRRRAESATTWRSATVGSPLQSLMARMVGTSSASSCRVASG